MAVPVRRLGLVRGCVFAAYCVASFLLGCVMSMLPVPREAASAVSLLGGMVVGSAGALHAMFGFRKDAGG